MNRDQLDVAGLITRPIVQQWAGFYQQVLGLRPLPLEPRGKECLKPDWNKPGRHFALDEFRDGDNVGIASDNGLVFHDDDAAKRGFQMGRAFLPRGGIFYGRASAPNSKAAYLCPDLIKTHTWEDLNNEHLQQLRVGLQDMVPPSIHPSGEPLKWSQPLYHGMLTPTPAADLIHACNLRATAVLIAQHWPAHGRRELLLAYARVLLETLGLAPATATDVLVLAAELGQFDHEGLDKARRAMASTQSALDKHEQALGAGHIRRVLPKGADLLRRLREWFGKTNAVEEAVERLNERYFIISVGAETVVGEQIVKSDRNRRWTEFQFQGFDDFKKRLIKQVVHVGVHEKKKTPIFKPLADVWLKHPHGVQFDQLRYAPKGSGEQLGPNDLNGWMGFTVTPADGDWSTIRNFIEIVICAGDPVVFRWLMDWCAALIQKPGQHGETAPILVGKQGVGKNFFAEKVLADSFDGRHAKTTSNMEQVIGSFNDMLSGTCLLVLDEVGLRTEREYNATKTLVTGHTLHINRKHISAVTERSMLHVIELSNDEVPVKVASDDRRFMFLHVADTYKNDVAFFAHLSRELENGGRAAMLADLLERAVDWDALRFAPDTKAKHKSKRASWNSVQWFFYRLLRETSALDWPTNASRHPFHQLKKDEAAGQYRVYLEETNSRREVKDARAELHEELRKLVPPDFPFNRPVSEAGVLSRDYWTLPDYETFCASFAAAVGCPIDELLAEEGGDVESVSDRAFASRDEDEIPF